MNYSNTLDRMKHIFHESQELYETVLLDCRHMDVDWPSNSKWVLIGPERPAVIGQNVYQLHQDKKHQQNQL